MAGKHLPLFQDRFNVVIVAYLSHDKYLTQGPDGFVMRFQHRNELIEHMKHETVQSDHIMSLMLLLTNRLILSLRGQYTLIMYFNVIILL
jgi:hypothetical protein